MTKKMSIDEILAACRAEKAPGGVPGASSPSSTAEEAVSAAAEVVEAATSAVPPKPAAGGSKPAGPMSVAEIMAAARAEKAGGAAPAPAAAAAAAAKPAASKPAADPKAMSVTDILAAARADKGAPKAAAAPPKPPAEPKAAAAKPVAAKAPAEPKAAKPTGPKDTSSILAAARKGPKPGPLSKEEAAKREIAAAKPQAKPVLPPMPERPAYLTPPAPKEAAGEPRRSFLSILFGSFLAIGFFSLGAFSALWGLGLARFLFPNILTEPPSKFKVGFPGDFPPNSVSEKFKAQFGVWVVNTEFEGMRQIVALKTVCTHLGCTPNWLDAERKFKCPCHGSGFYIDGVNFEGPAPRPLERYAIRIADDGQLEIDKSKKFQQELGQWANPSCYVTV